MLPPTSYFLLPTCSEETSTTDSLERPRRSESAMAMVEAARRN